MSTRTEELATWYNKVGKKEAEKEMKNWLNQIGGQQFIESRIDERPSDLIEYILKTIPDGDIRKSCIKVIRSQINPIIKKFLYADYLSDKQLELMKTVLYILESAEPNELKYIPETLSRDIFDNIACNTYSLESKIIRVYLAYEKIIIISKWNELLNKKNLCAYAFRGILQNDNDGEETGKALVLLWKRKLHENWDVSTITLTWFAVNDCRFTLLEKQRKIIECLKNSKDWEKIKSEIINSELGKGLMEIPGFLT